MNSRIVRMHVSSWITSTRTPSRAQPLLFAEKGAVLADDDVRNTVEKNGARTHRAGRQRRIHDGRAIDGRRLAACALERIHFSVKHGAALLNTTIVTAADDCAAVNERRSNRNASLIAATFGFFDGCFEK